MDRQGTSIYYVTIELYGDWGLELIIKGVVRDKSGNWGGLGNNFATLGIKS